MIQEENKLEDLIQECRKFWRRLNYSKYLIKQQTKDSELIFDSMEENTKHKFLNISEYFESQIGGAYCGIASLTISLNYLFSINEENQKFAKFTQEYIYKNGVKDIIWKNRKDQNYGLRLNSLQIILNKLILPYKLKLEFQQSIYYDAQYKQFIQDLQKCYIEDKHQKSIIIVNFCRNYKEHLGGHFCPIGGFACIKGLEFVFIVDVAAKRAKPHWFPVRYLVRLMCNMDQKIPRGYLILSIINLNRRQQREFIEEMNKSTILNGSSILNDSFQAEKERYQQRSMDKLKIFEKSASINNTRRQTHAVTFSLDGKLDKIINQTLRGQITSHNRENYLATPSHSLGRKTPSQSQQKVKRKFLSQSNSISKKSILTTRVHNGNQLSFTEGESNSAMGHHSLGGNNFRLDHKSTPVPSGITLAPNRSSTTNSQKKLRRATNKSTSRKQDKDSVKDIIYSMKKQASKIKSCLSMNLPPHNKSRSPNRSNKSGLMGPNKSEGLKYIKRSLGDKDFNQSMMSQSLYTGDSLGTDGGGPPSTADTKNKNPTKVVITDTLTNEEILDNSNTVTINVDRSISVKNTLPSKSTRTNKNMKNAFNQERLDKKAILESKNKQIEEEKNKLNNDIVGLKEENQILSDDIEDFRATLDALLNQNKSLKKDIREEKSRKEDFLRNKLRNKYLMQENTLLKNKNTNLVFKIKTIFEFLKEVEVEYSQSEIENENILMDLSRENEYLREMLNLMQSTESKIQIEESISQEEEKLIIQEYHDSEPLEKAISAGLINVENQNTEETKPEIDSKEETKPEIDSKEEPATTKKGEEGEEISTNINNGLDEEISIKKVLPLPVHKFSEEIPKAVKDQLLEARVKKELRKKSKEKSDKERQEGNHKREGGKHPMLSNINEKYNYIYELMYDEDNEQEFEEEGLGEYGSFNYIYDYAGYEEEEEDSPSSKNKQLTRPTNKPFKEDEEERKQEKHIIEDRSTGEHLEQEHMNKNLGAGERPSRKLENPSQAFLNLSKKNARGDKRHYDSDQL